jgi:hypothetical protein
MSSTDALDCQRCGHDYTTHQPACTVDESTDRACVCARFRWVDPTPAPDVLGYHRPQFSD